MKVNWFEWDKWNTGHIEERHGFFPEEVEEVFFSRPVIRRVRGGRFAAYGQTEEGLYLTVIFHLKPAALPASSPPEI